MDNDRNETLDDEGGPLCPSCFLPIEGDPDFCPHCGAPLGATVSIDPIWRIRTMGYIVRKGADTRASRLILLGVITFFAVVLLSASVLTGLHDYFDVEVASAPAMTKYVLLGAGVVSVATVAMLYFLNKPRPVASDHAANNESDRK